MTPALCALQAGAVWTERGPCTPQVCVTLAAGVRAGITSCDLAAVARQGLLGLTQAVRSSISISQAGLDPQRQAWGTHLGSSEQGKLEMCSWLIAVCICGFMHTLPASCLCLSTSLRQPQPQAWGTPERQSLDP